MVQAATPPIPRFHKNAYGFVSPKQLKGADPKLVKDQLQALQDLYRKCGKAVFSSQMFWILRKNPEPGEKDVLGNLIQAGQAWNKRLVPFKHNRIQKDLDAHMGPRNIMLKPRQGGYTTYCIIMRLLLSAILEPGVGCLLISQNSKYAAAHFTILQRAFRYFGVVDPYNKSSNLLSDQLHQHLLSTKFSNRHELIFDQLDSRILCESAENEEAGQGLTIQHLHCSEVARWPGKPEETLANVKEAIPIDGSVDIESTANQMGGYFYEECQRAKDGLTSGKETEFRFFFHEWWWHDEYRLDRPVAEESVSEEEELLIQKFKLDLHQIAWRRKKMVSLRHNFQEKYPEDDIKCFLLQGAGFFDGEVVGQRSLELKGSKPYDSFKKTVIFKPRQKNKRYIIGADVATGRVISENNTDYSAAFVLDLETGETVCRYMARISEEYYAQDLADIGEMYNNALIAVERNSYGGAVILSLEVSCRYMNLYKHREWYKRERKVVEVLGFPTTVKTRPLLLNRAKALVEKSPELIHDEELLKQCLVFVNNEKGKPEAVQGSHDDLVMALGIANYCRLVVLGYIDPVGIPSEKYGTDVDEAGYAAEEE